MNDLEQEKALGIKVLDRPNITIELDEAEVEALHDLLSHANSADYEANHSLSEKLDNARF